MIICHCKAVSDRDIEAAAKSGARTVEAVAKRCGAGTDCTSCHRIILAIVDEGDEAEIAPIGALPVPA